MNEREQNREAMPVCREWVDRIRTMYGAENVKVRWLSENGLEVGKRPDDAASTWGLPDTCDAERCAA